MNSSQKADLKKFLLSRSLVGAFILWALLSSVTLKLTEQGPPEPQTVTMAKPAYETSIQNLENNIRDLRIILAEKYSVGSWEERGEAGEGLCNMEGTERYSSLSSWHAGSIPPEKLAAALLEVAQFFAEHGYDPEETPPFGTRGWEGAYGSVTLDIRPGVGTVLEGNVGCRPTLEKLEQRLS